MKKILKLTAFNLGFVALSVVCFSKRLLGITFDPGIGALKFALTISLSILGTLLYFYGNYKFLTQKEMIEYKDFGRLTTVEQCIDALERCKRTDPSFKDELTKAISQLEVLLRRDHSLKTLLEQNDLANAFSYLSDTADKAKEYMIANVRRIINRLIVFDNQEYLETNDLSDFSNHQKYILEVIDNSDELLKEYQKMLVAISNIGDTNLTNLDDIKRMTKALNIVLRGDELQALEQKYATEEEQHNE